MKTKQKNQKGGGLHNAKFKFEIGEKVQMDGVKGKHEGKIIDRCKASDSSIRYDVETHPEKPYPLNKQISIPERVLERVEEGQ